jgi:hypothetical protein
MTAYSDVPQANTLINEQNSIRNAVGIIDGGGTMKNLTVASRPPTGSPTAVNVILTDPASSNTLASVRVDLMARDTEITTLLANLGVTNPPAPPT